MAKKTLFDVLYSAGEAAIQEMKKPGRVKMIRRAAERQASELEGKRIDAELKKSEILKKIAKEADEDEANELFLELAEAQIEIEEAEALAAKVKASCEELFSLYEGTVEG